MSLFVGLHNAEAHVRERGLRFVQSDRTITVIALLYHYWICPLLALCQHNALAFFEVVR